jgi:hypothetical protein
VAAEIDGLMDGVSVTNVVSGRRWGRRILRALWSTGLSNGWDSNEGRGDGDG